MALTDNEQLQETLLLIGDKLAPVKKIWWYALLLALVLAIPGYFLVKTMFVEVFLGGYSGPQVIFTATAKAPLTVSDKQIFSFPDNTYSGYVKIKNLNLDWGVASQEYHVEFETFGGTVLQTLDQSTFILPSSEKLIVLPRFSSPQKPDQIVVTLGSTDFIHEPDTTVNFEVQRISLKNNSSGLVVSGAFINQSPYTISEVDLPVIVYNSQNQIVAVNFTNINTVAPSETRTFQYSWPTAVPGAIRAEINPEIDVFNRNLLAAPAGVSPFSNSTDGP